MNQLNALSNRVEYYASRHMLTVWTEAKRHEKPFILEQIRLLNADVIDLYSRVDVGTKIIVLPNRAAVAAIAAGLL